MTTGAMIEILEKMLALWAKFDVDAYEGLTGDDEASSRVAGTLRSMISDLRDGVEEDEEEGDD